MRLEKKSGEAMEQTVEAFRRMRNIETPMSAKRTREEHWWELLPCVEVDRCMECDAGNRISNLTTIIEKKTRAIDVSPLIIGEELAL